MLEYLAEEEQRLKDWEATLAKGWEELLEARNNITASEQDLDRERNEIQQQQLHLDNLEKDVASRIELLGQTISGPAAVGDSPSAWGKPRSSLRLKRIAFSIAKFLALAQGRDNAESYRRAVRHWQCDLQWLAS